MRSFVKLSSQPARIRAYQSNVSLNRYSVQYSLTCMVGIKNYRPVWRVIVPLTCFSKAFVRNKASVRVTDASRLKRSRRPLGLSKVQYYPRRAC